LLYFYTAFKRTHKAAGISVSLKGENLEVKKESVKVSVEANKPYELD